MAGITRLVISSVLLDPHVGGGGFSEGAEKAGEGFGFDAAEPGCHVSGEVVSAEDGGEVGELVGAGDEGVEKLASTPTDEPT